MNEKKKHVIEWIEVHKDFSIIIHNFNLAQQMLLLFLRKNPTYNLFIRIFILNI
jgi:hypothetical protein